MTEWQRNNWETPLPRISKDLGVISGDLIAIEADCRAILAILNRIETKIDQTNAHQEEQP